MANEAPWMRSENALGEDRSPTSGQSPEQSRSSQTAMPSPMGGVNDQDLAVLRQAFTPQVIEALSRLAQSGGTEPGATGPMPASGAMPEQPVAEPTLPRPTTRLSQMMG